jgi:phosphoglycolate phosphatase
MAWPGAVIFDLDGTLIDTAPAIACALNHVIATRRGEEVAVSLVRKLISRGAPELVGTAFGKSASSPERDLRDFRAAYGALDPKSQDLYPGAMETLRFLNEKGIRLGLCTNKPQSLTNALLDKLNLSPLFAAVIGGDLVPRAKPHPDHLLAVLSALEAAPSDAFYVGDSEVDAQTARGAEVTFVLARYGYASVSLETISCWKQISGLNEIPALLPIGPPTPSKPRCPI